MAETPGESFVLVDEDSIAPVQATHLEVCESSRQVTATLGLDDVLRGNRRGPLPLRWVYLHAPANLPSTAATPTSCVNSF